jgi:hypothetical protein
MKTKKVIISLSMILLFTILSSSIKADENDIQGPDLIITETLQIDSIPTLGKDVEIIFKVKNVGIEDTDYISLQVILYSESGTPLALLSNEYDIYGFVDGNKYHFVNGFSNRSVRVNETISFQLIWKTGQQIKSNETFSGYNPSPGVYRISLNISGSNDDVEQSKSFSIQLKESFEDISESIPILGIIIIVGVLLSIAIIMAARTKKKKKK